MARQRHLASGRAECRSAAFKYRDRNHVMTSGGSGLRRFGVIWPGNVQNARRVAFREPNGNDV